MIEEQIKELLQQQNKKVKDLCAYIDMTDTALRKIYERDSCEIRTLKKIANFFEVSPCYFLGEDKKVSITAGKHAIAVGGNATNINSIKAILDMVAEISAQRKLTEKAMNQIDRLVDVISNLSNQNNSLVK